MGRNYSWIKLHSDKNIWNVFIRLSESIFRKEIAMNHNTQINTRIKLENIVILFIVLASLALLILSFLPSLPVSAAVRVSLEMGKMVQRAFSIVLLAVSLQLMKRRRAAWYITIFILLLNFIRGFSEFRHPARLVIMAVDLVLLIIFVCFREDFCCPSSKRSKKAAAVFLLLSLAGIAANAGLSYHYMKLGSPDNAGSLWDSLVSGTGMIFGMGDGLQGMYGKTKYEMAIFWFSWGCILAAVTYAAKPWFQSRRSGKSDIQHARTLLGLYSQNPCSYLALEDDKYLYFGSGRDGVIPYGTVGETVIVNGDPVCADEDFPALLEEFKEFCQKSAHKLFFLSVTDHFLEEYRKQGFGCVKCGEEARFRLSEYELSGKKGAKMRMNLNHAAKAGVTVQEYRVLEQRDPVIEQEFERITQEWLQEKKSSLLKFTLGSVGLDEPMDKRYFYALDASGKMAAFIVFVPFLGKKGYMADVTRHGKEAPGGVMETIIYQAFQIFCQEGVEYGSLGVAPLAGLEENSSNMVERLLRFVYDHLNDCYGFRDLYRAKEKYSPTEWVPSYYVYLPRIPTPDMFYAVARIQNPRGMWDYAVAFVKGRFKKKEAHQ